MAQLLLQTTMLTTLYIWEVLPIGADQASLPWGITLWTGKGKNGVLYEANSETQAHLWACVFH